MNNNTLPSLTAETTLGESSTKAVNNGNANNVVVNTNRSWWNRLVRWVTGAEREKRLKQIHDEVCGRILYPQAFGPEPKRHEMTCKGVTTYYWK